MLTLQNLSFEFGGRWLYKDVSWQIKPGDKTGLIGRNGCGKSTLLRLMVGEYTPTEGKITKAKDYKIGFLNQDLLSFSSDEPIFNVALSAFTEQLSLKKDIDGLLLRLENENSSEILHELDQLQQRFAALDGYMIEVKTHEVLDGLGFKENQRFAPYNTFSGGWRMRVMLAKILLGEPDLLLLDEPTNHLDLPSIEWLEQYVANFQGSYVIVSHDRSILERMVTDIVEVANLKLNFYAGAFNFYLTAKQEREVLQRGAWENQQKFIQETESFINRFRAKASKASQVQSRVKMLEKLEIIHPPESETKPPNFRFIPAMPTGVDVLSLKEVHKNYGEKIILQKASAIIHRHDKIGLIGANGVGKSTVLRILAGTEPMQNGKRIIGHQVIPTFFAQHQLEALTITNSIWEEMQEFALELGDGYVRSVLGGLLFSGESVDNKISVLSGGEKSRVALAKTLMSKANFLLLDEPTNHLDMQSIEILINALQQYNGSYILVSHDRYFLSNVTNKIWYIEDSEIKEYPGTFEEYEYWQKKQNSDATTLNFKPTKAPVAKASKGKSDSLDWKKSKQLNNQLKKYEQQIEKLEAQKTLILGKMADPQIAADFSHLKQLQSNLTELEKDMEQTWHQLAVINDELEAMET